MAFQTLRSSEYMSFREQGYIYKGIWELKKYTIYETTWSETSALYSLNMNQHAKQSNQHNVINKERCEIQFEPRVLWTNANQHASLQTSTQKVEWDVFSKSSQIGFKISSSL